MTKKQLKTRCAIVIFYLLSLVVLAIIDKTSFSRAVYGHLSGEIYVFMKEFSSMLIAAAAAYLAYCFSRRQIFIASLRELWKMSVEAKGKLLQYTHLQSPTQKDFGEAYTAISSTIDNMRSVYRNVKESDERVGLFPFEALHDMRKSLERIGFINVTWAIRKNERQNIIQAWNSFRFVFLKEFQAPEPTYSITKRNSKDPRKID
ncbi:hypothetical protein [Methylobacterium nonmethylotrophicum]|uniref:Uncharacterized protein n=1 Tax=Methylobacterium nonmethylotrophicum TaxID=1141884 RepID=A0A4Z0NKH1_9HYPH|nr:hypothetical protein [Methylobacterium nonmethylotrophicum]TGD96903.1 hypothetical protein EU555_21185 [Methylobacterium nonmethylotrophicum]